MSRLAFALVTTVLAILASKAAADDAVQAKCLAGKTKCVSKLTAGLLKCRQVATTPGKPSDPNAGGCLDKATSKFDGGPDPTKGCFAKLEAKSPNDCVTTSDTDALHGLADACLTTALDGVDAPPIDQTKCGVGKIKCAGKKLKGLLKCHALAATPGKSIDPNAGGCLDAVRAKFDGGPEPLKGCFAKLETKAGNDCLSPTGNTDAIETAIDDCVSDLMTALVTPTATTTSTSTSTPTTASTSSTTTSTSRPSTTSTSTSNPVPTTTSTSSTTSSSTSTSTTTLPISATCDADGVTARIAISRGNLGGAVADLRYTSIVSFPGNGFETDPDGDHLTDLTGKGGVLIGVDADTNGDTIDDRLRITYALSGGATFGPGAWVAARFDCPPSTVVTSAAFTCTIVSASDPAGNPASGVTCFVQQLQ